MIRVLIADDHPVVRDGLRTILETAPDLELVGEAADGAEAVEAALRVQPDVVLMDLRMPRVDGIEAITQIRRQRPETAIVILTTYDDDELIVRGLRAGARGYLLKDTARAELFSTIRAAHRGDLTLPSDLADKMLEHLELAQPAAARETTGRDITERELEVLRLMVDGAANKQIASRLGISERTVKAHVSSLFMKLDVSSRAEAVAVALRTGLVSSGT